MVEKTIIFVDDDFLYNFSKHFDDGSLNDIEESK